MAKLREARRAAEAWLERVRPILDTDMPVELRTVEQLVADGRRLWVALDQVDALKMRMSAARRLADEVSPQGFRFRIWVRASSLDALSPGMLLGPALWPHGRKYAGRGIYMPRQRPSHCCNRWIISQYPPGGGLPLERKTNICRHRQRSLPCTMVRRAAAMTAMALAGGVPPEAQQTCLRPRMQTSSLCWWPTSAVRCALADLCFACESWMLMHRHAQVLMGSSRTTVAHSILTPAMTTEQNALLTIPATDSTVATGLHTHPLLTSPSQNVVIPELEPLEEAVASFGKWRSRARGLLAARPTLSQLKEAVEEAAALRVSSCYPPLLTAQALLLRSVQRHCTIFPRSMLGYSEVTLSCVS